MYSKFKLNQSVFENFSFNNLDLISGKNIGENFKNQLTKSLRHKFEDNKIIDGTAIQEDWFSNIECDIFLSHSHKDIEKANKFAGWVKKELGLIVFIDYNIWGNMRDLLKQIDKRYCYDPKKKTYDYDKRNETTSHVHMMLINALTDMMDKTECLMFFESPNSINMSKLKYETETRSPWIYNELFFSKVLRKKPKPRDTDLRSSNESVKLFRYMNEGFNPVYKANTDHLVDLENMDIIFWKMLKAQNPGTHSLDLLYSMKKIKG